jgi:hypothetical protein
MPMRLRQATMPYQLFEDRLPEQRENFSVVQPCFVSLLEFFKVREDKIEKCKMSNEYAKALRRGTKARPAQVCCGEDPDDESEAKRFISFTK